jgi:hypothetical protein
MEPATTQEDLDKPAADYAAKVETIVDLSKLNYQLAQAEKFDRYGYIAVTWADFVKAYEAAKNVDLNDQAAVDAAAAALDAAIYALADISEISNVAKKAIEAAKALVEADYDPAGWKVMLAALAVAEEAYENDDTELMDSAILELNNAVDALISIKELKALIDELTALEEANYSVASFVPVKSALVVANAALTATSQATADNALAALKAAKAGLADVTTLNELIAKVEELTRTEVAVVSVGPDREQTIIRKDIF